MTIIVDASVAAKWLFQEPETDKARALLGEVRTGKLSMLAPELLPVEVASSLWKRVYRQGLPAGEVEAQYHRFVRLCPDGARDRDRGGGLETACSLVTADEKLYFKFAAGFPQIRLLRDWS